MLRAFWLFFILSSTTIAFAQEGIGYFYDYTHHLNVFEQGGTSDIENGKVTDIHSGFNYLAYVDSRNSFVAYYNRDKQTLEEFPPTKIIATPYALVYQCRNRLMVFENGTKRLLSKFSGDFDASDSMVVWQSQPDLNIMVYYKGEISTVELSVSTDVLRDSKIGQNIFAFTNTAYDFMIYFNGKTYESGRSRISDYACGKNIAAFTDIYKNTFEVFYNGEFKVLSNKTPKSFIVSNETVAFVDADDNFYIFFRGSLIKIESFAPDYYNTANNIIYYSYSSQLKMIYDANIVSDRNIDQQNIITGMNSILYYTQSNTPVYFYKGKKTSDFYVPKPYSFQLNGDLPVFTYNNNIAFYYDGKLYEYECRNN